jgi:uncharacterized protein (TIGR02231 family)
MRRILLLSVLFPACAFADQIPATSRITEVTIYAQGAWVQREVTFDAPAGRHELMLDDLPMAAAVDDAIRIRPGAGVSVGAHALATDGIPLAQPRLSRVQAEAEARLREAEAAERAILDRIDGIGARIEAADARIGFLRGLNTGTDGLDGAPPQEMQAMAAMIGTEAAGAAADRAAALAERRVADADLARQRIDLQRAQAAVAMLGDGQGESGPVLRIDVATAAAGPGTLQVGYFVDNVGWQPVYDIDLARADGRMTVERGVTVTQYSGEDWTDVMLTLSTANPGQQSAPSALYPDLRRISPPEPPRGEASYDMMAGAPAPAPAEVVAEPMVESRMAASADFQGDTVVYRYDQPVSLASGVETLRVALGTVDLAPALKAIAVPRQDRTAYLVATTTNTSPEILLPGPAMLSRDGVLIGSTYLDIIAPGVEFDLSFGPIEGLRLTRALPVRAEGETGILTSSSQIEESATLKIENNTPEAWDLRVLDQVPYSEQEDLEITYSADPEPTETDVEGVRGHLAWEFSLPAGETREIRLDHLISWPEGMILQ